MSLTENLKSRITRQKTILVWVIAAGSIPFFYNACSQSAFEAAKRSYSSGLNNSESEGGSPLPDTPDTENPVSQNPVGGTPVGEMPNPATPVGQTPVGEMPNSGTPIGQTPVGEMPSPGTPVGGMPDTQTPGNGNPVVSPPGSGTSTGVNQCSITATNPNSVKARRNSLVGAQLARSAEQCLSICQQHPSAGYCFWQDLGVLSDCFIFDQNAISQPSSVSNLINKNAGVTSKAITCSSQIQPTFGNPQQLVALMYKHFLMRSPNSTEVNYYISNPAQKGTCEALGRGIGNSPEFRSRAQIDLLDLYHEKLISSAVWDSRAILINSAYQGFLGRPSDISGLDHFSDLYDGTNWPAVVERFITSAEYKTRCKNFGIN